MERIRNTVSSMILVMIMKLGSEFSQIRMTLRQNQFYFQGAAVLCTVLQRYVAKMDEHGTQARGKWKWKLKRVTRKHYVFVWGVRYGTHKVQSAVTVF